MADITENEVRTFIALKLPSGAEIPAVDHRAVENKIMDYVIQELGKTTKSKPLILDTFTTDRNYSIATGLSSSAVIDGVVMMLVCKNENNGFYEGDVVTAPTPYPYDANRTAAQGIGVQYNNLSNASIKVMVNDEITIMGAYNSTPDATADPIRISGSGTANWSLKLIVIYK